VAVRTSNEEAEEGPVITARSIDDPYLEPILESLAASPSARGASLEDIRVGSFWSAVTTSLGTGLASTLSGEAHRHGSPPVADAGRLLERRPLELAALARSESVTEASIGVAAINALLGEPKGRVSEDNASEILTARAAARSLAMIGRFPFVERLEQVCSAVWVFERGARREPGEHGTDEMSELLPHADAVAVSATTLINHTLGGILEHVSPGAFLMMLGPSTPMHPSLLMAGFDVLCGTCADDPSRVLAAVSQGAVTKQIPGVRRLCLWRGR
jgi:uncharacterized protein (DUF4213/DUF364 family)